MATRLGVATYEKNKVSRIINSITFGIIITDVQDNIDYVNDYMLKLLERSWDDIVDQPLRVIFNQDEILSFLSEQDSMNSANPGHVETTFPDLWTGETFQVSLAYMKDAEGAVNGKMLFVKNITRDKSAEETRIEFIANVAHEFMTPLTTIKSYNEMLMDGEIDDKAMQVEFYNTISEETNRLSRLIQTLLSISKIELGSLTLNSGPIKTDLLVEDCLVAVEKNAGDKKISIEKILPDKFPTLVGDKELLQTALINLLGNSVKYSPDESRITFSLEEQDNMVVFEVTDTGYGISEEDLPHIFDKFYRAGDPNIKAQTGTGLGLAMTSEIIHLHNGKIEVQSELGEGTQFIVRIPKGEYYLGNQ
jgi:signal transduction histidine kinase